MKRQWRKINEGGTERGSEWARTKHPFTNLRYCRQTPICGSSRWKLWLLSESSDWSALRDKLLHFFCGGSSDSGIQNKEFLCRNAEISLLYKCDAKKSPSCIVRNRYSSERHAIKRRVVPLCLFFRQLISLFPDRTAVLNSSWHLLSPVSKIIKN